jgi:acyl carrier protein
MRGEILKAINQVTAKKHRAPLAAYDASLRLREDLGLDSLDLAELTVRLEAVSGVDIFAKGVVRTLGEVEARLADTQRL